MSKTQFYLSQCADAASKSPMCFTLGAVLVKGGKVISSGHNHHRPHYDGAEVRTRGHRKPVSMHAEMHAIFSLTGMSPSFRKQRQGARAGAAPQLQTPCFARAPPPPSPPPPPFKGEAPLAAREGHPDCFGPLSLPHGQAVSVFVF
jgi:pyrimidine deaminase RibD-like protein